MSMIEGVLAGMSMRTRQQQDEEDRAHLKKKREQEDDDRAFTMSERQRAIQMRTDLGRAASKVEPVEVKQDRPDTMDDRDVGQPGEAPLPTAGYDVDGKRFTDLTSARAAAAEANTPQAVTARMSDVLMRNGDPIGAQKLRVGAMEEQTSQFKLNDAMRADIDAKFNADIRARVTDWDSLDKFVSDSASDGHGGAIKLKTVPSADGKTRVVNVVLPDGSLKPTEKVFPNTADGLATAAAELERMPAEKKLAHLHQKAMLARQLAADESSAKYHEGMLGVAQQNANTQEQWRRDQAAAASTKAGNAVERMSEAGKIQLNDINKQDEALAAAINKGVAEGSLKPGNPDDPAWAHLNQQRQQLGIQKLRIFAREGLIDGASKAADLIAAGATPQDLVASKAQAQLIGGEYASDFIKAIDAHMAPKSKAEAVAQAVEKNGDKNYVVQLNGRTQTYGSAGSNSGSPSMVQVASRAKPTANSFAGNDAAFAAMSLPELRRYIDVGNAYAKRELARRTAAEADKSKASKAADDYLMRQAAAQGLTPQ